MKVIKKAPRVFHAKNVRMYLKNADGTETEFRFVDISGISIDIYDTRKERKKP